MIVEERAQGDQYLVEHDKYKDTLNKDLQILDEDYVATIPVIYKDGELTPLEQWQKEFAQIKEKAVARFNQNEDVAPHVNQVVFDLFSLEIDMKKRARMLDAIRVTVILIILACLISLSFTLLSSCNQVVNDEGT